MSYCTLYENKDKILKYYEEIKNTEQNSNNKSRWQLVGEIISKLILTQWDLRRKYYNKNLLLKHKYELDIKGNTFIEYLHQHIYNHSHSALTDELFEVQDALDKLEKYSNDDPKLNIAKALVIEELIDCVFFIVEQTSNLETHYQLLLDNNKYYLNSYHIKDYLTGYNSFSDRIRIMCKEEGFHICTDIYSHKDNIKTMPDTIYNVLKINRNFLRETGWKDWKIYDEDYYNPSKFGNLFTLNRELYCSICSLFYRYSDIVCSFVNEIGIDNYNQKDHISDLFKFIYACFMVKAEENEYRMTSDKRYNNKNSGEIHGQEI